MRFILALARRAAWRGARCRHAPIARARARSSATLREVEVQPSHELGDDALVCAGNILVLCAGGAGATPDREH